MSIIWSLIICYIVYRTVVRQRNSGNGKGGSGSPPVINTTSMRHREQRNARPVNQQANRPADNQMRQAAVLQKQTTGKPSEKQEISTMAYLEEKARQDAAEHARDKWEEAKRLNQNYGGLRVAERLFDGDIVPGGKKCAVCEYCGAENLIPMIPRERYSCYFCREPL